MRLHLIMEMRGLLAYKHPFVRSTCGFTSGQDNEIHSYEYWICKICLIFMTMQLMTGMCAMKLLCTARSPHNDQPFAVFLQFAKCCVEAYMNKTRVRQVPHWTAVFSAVLLSGRVLLLHWSLFFVSCESLTAEWGRMRAAGGRREGREWGGREGGGGKRGKVKEKGEGGRGEEEGEEQRIWMWEEKGANKMRASLQHLVFYQWESLCTISPNNMQRVLVSMFAVTRSRLMYILCSVILQLWTFKSNLLHT